MSRVFVVQEPSTRVRGQWVPKFDLSAAEAFGDLVRCLPPGNVPEDPEPTRRSLTAALEGFDFRSDYVLLLGDPVAIAQAVSVLERMNLPGFAAEPIRLLKWDRRAQEYAPYSVG